MKSFIKILSKEEFTEDALKYNEDYAGILILFEEKHIEYNSSNINKSIKDFVSDLGFNSYYLGTKYLIEAIKIVLEIGDRYFNICNDVYEKIASKYNSSIECVEASIRKRTKSTYELNKEKWNANYNLKYDKGNKKFLDDIKNYLLNQIIK